MPAVALSRVGARVTFGEDAAASRTGRGPVNLVIKLKAGGQLVRHPNYTHLVPQAFHGVTAMLGSRVTVATRP